ncbi:MAG: bifunctional glutamate N-acetyltransferase/amino-acid acetyltransferase ArgJ [Actinomycetes bacterium]
MSDPFESRWVPKPAHVTPIADSLPAGFEAAAGSASIKPSGKPDLALIRCDAPESVSSLRQTRSSAAAAPVLVNRERLRSESVRVAVVNSGNANAGTGEDGYGDALAIRSAAASALGVEEDLVAVFSTGIIGRRLDAQAVAAALPGIAERLGPNGAGELAEAILTTDRGPKSASLEVELSGGTVRLCAQAKGAGMIQPSFATMLCFIQTDAKLSADTASLLLGATVRRSFERISVDGQLSTNDAVLLMASGASGIAVEPESPDELRLGEALDSLLRSLALQIVADGEGAARVARLVVEGGDDELVEHVARTVAGSPLVKAALNGGDPNWGRILGAVGMALPDNPRLPIDIEIEGVPVCVAGSGVPHDERALAAAVIRPEVEYLVRIPGSGAACEVFFSDLSHEYVTINSEYTT